MGRRRNSSWGNQRKNQREGTEPGAGRTEAKPLLSSSMPLWCPCCLPFVPPTPLSPPGPTAHKRSLPSARPIRDKSLPDLAIQIIIFRKRYSLNDWDYMPNMDWKPVTKLQTIFFIQQRINFINISRFRVLVSYRDHSYHTNLKRRSDLCMKTWCRIYALPNKGILHTVAVFTILKENYESILQSPYITKLLNQHYAQIMLQQF